MKTIVVYDIDGFIPNFALMKISTFYRNKGYKVRLSKEIIYIKGCRYFASAVFHNEGTDRKIKALFSKASEECNAARQQPSCG